MVRLTSSLAVLILVFGISSWASGEVVFQDDFDGYTTDSSLPNPPWETIVNTVTVEVDDTIYVGSSGKSVHIVDSGPDVHAAFIRTFPRTSWYQLDYDMRTAGRDVEGIGVTLMGDAGDDYLVSFAMGVHGSLADHIGIHGGRDGWIEPPDPLVPYLPYETDTWYHVERRLNLATDEGWFRVWKHGEKGNPLYDATYLVGSEYANTYIDRITFGSPLTVGADGHIDNLKLTAIPEPSTFTLLCIGAVGLLAYACRKQRRQSRLPG